MLLAREGGERQGAARHAAPCHSPGLRHDNLFEHLLHRERGADLDAQMGLAGAGVGERVRYARRHLDLDAAGLLDGPRARGAFLLRSLLDPPWSMRIQDQAPLCLVALTQGEAWLLPDDGDARRLLPGDVAIIRGPDPYTLASDPATAPQVIIDPGQNCTTPDGDEVQLMQFMGVRTWGNSPEGSTVMLNGTYEAEGEVSRRLMGRCRRCSSCAPTPGSHRSSPCSRPRSSRTTPGRRPSSTACSTFC